DSLANPRQSTDDVAVRPPDADPAKARTYVPAEGIAAEVHLFSDGRFPDVAEFAAGNLDLKYHRVGKDGPDQDNLGIVTFNAFRHEQTPGKVQVFITVRNFRSKEAETRAELEVRGKTPADYKRYVYPENGMLRLKPRAYSKGNPETGEPAVDRPGQSEPPV